ncbi:hypothetical protein DUI87_23301 [Hirundo rustica rustica]|uniref:Uncharacterized protein n=1 Tax=Hirundo rustica rustica TaxID=333673 RepID=A0A3M0JIF1_HIRRU|nr:hypothetical protein DUI87_23301 [Hirundo rustica rustica]
MVTSLSLEQGMLSSQGYPRYYTEIPTPKVRSLLIGRGEERRGEERRGEERERRGEERERRGEERRGEERRERRGEERRGEERRGEERRGEERRGEERRGEERRGEERRRGEGEERRGERGEERRGEERRGEERRGEERRGEERRGGWTAGQEINISTPHLDPTINSIVLLRRSNQTLGTETCMINEDASEEGPSKSRVSLRDPVYKKRLLQTEEVNLGDNRLAECVIIVHPVATPGSTLSFLIVAVRDCHFVSQ